MYRFRLFLGGAAIVSACCVPLVAYFVAAHRHAKWHIIYIMAYDNDLARHQGFILDAIERGVTSAETLATVLADDPEPNGLTRYVISPRGRTAQRLITDDIASEAVLSDFLRWVATAHPAEKYAVVFLDHGGRLDELCFDEQPGGGSTKHWLNARVVVDRLRAFRAVVPGSVELVFLQQCGRGSVQNLYNFRGTAKAVLASQHDVGAPNTYYEPTLRWLVAHPDASGADLASRIMADDRDFVTYCCVDGERLGELPRQLEPVVRTLLEDNAPSPPPVELAPCFVAGGEDNFDLLAWLEAAFRKDRRSPTALDEFSQWIRDRLIVRCATSPHAAARCRHVCGLSLFVPRSEDQLIRYRDEPLHHDCSLGKLWDVVMARLPRR